jgi:hypothetical protein
MPREDGFSLADVLIREAKNSETTISEKWVALPRGCTEDEVFACAEGLSP